MHLHQRGSTRSHNVLETTVLCHLLGTTRADVTNVLRPMPHEVRIAAARVEHIKHLRVTFVQRFLHGTLPRRGMRHRRSEQRQSRAMSCSWAGNTRPRRCISRTWTRTGIGDYTRSAPNSAQTRSGVLGRCTRSSPASPSRHSDAADSAKSRHAHSNRW